MNEPGTPITTLTSPLEWTVQRDRAVALAALLFVAGVSAWLMLRAGDALMALPPWTPITAGWLLLLFLMWWTMMLAMMLPSAAPAILTFGSISKRLDGAHAGVRQFAFTLGYLAVWTGFSLAAVLLQLVAGRLMRLDPMYATASRGIGGTLLILAGIYQMTPLKNACLRKCQLPLFYFAKNWRTGLGGAFSLGARHGLYCLGCCAVLMAVLFYGGVMEPRWIGGLALYILAEKLLPPRWQISRMIGALLIGWGAAVLFFAI